MDVIEDDSENDFSDSQSNSNLSGLSKASDARGLDFVSAYDGHLDG